MGTNMVTSKKITWIGVVFLIALEQLIKIIINNKYLNIEIPILPPLLYFKPMFNRDYSWFNSMLQLGISRLLHIIVVVVMIIFIYLFYRVLSSRTSNSNSIINIMFAFIFSGAICSLIDKIFWNGSLDYIMLKGLFTFDLKDIYVNVSFTLLILLMIAKNKVLKQFDDDNLLKDFTKYILRK